METQDNQNKKNKKPQGFDWEGFAWQFGSIALKGVIGGMASAVGANVANRALNARAGRSSVTSGDNVVKFQKTGTV